MNHTGCLEDVSPSVWNDMMALNLTAPYFITRHFISSMKSKGWLFTIHIYFNGDYHMEVYGSQHKTL